MRKLLGSVLLLTLCVPLLAVAQRRPAAQARPAPSQREFGVDLGLAWYDQDGGSTGIRFGTPLDVRLGFPSRTKVKWEGRLSLGFDSKGGLDAAGDPASSYAFTPGVNVLYAMNPGGHRSGMFLTGGLGLNLVDGGELGGAGFSLNSAVGWRKPYGSGGAIRYEIGVRWDSEITATPDGGGGGPAPADVVLLPSTLSIGARVGISLWH